MKSRKSLIRIIGALALFATVSCATRSLLNERMNCAKNRPFCEFDYNEIYYECIYQDRSYRICRSSSFSNGINYTNVLDFVGILNRVKGCYLDLVPDRAEVFDDSVVNIMSTNSSYMRSGGMVSCDSEICGITFCSDRNDLDDRDKRSTIYISNSCLDLKTLAEVMYKQMSCRTIGVNHSNEAAIKFANSKCVRSIE